MKIENGLLVYEIVDEDKFPAHWQRLTCEVRETVRDTYTRLCDDFGVISFGQIPVSFCEGDVLDSGTIAPTSSGCAFTLIENGVLKCTDIYITLPFLRAMTDHVIEVTAPHEVAHVFADQIYGRYIQHDEEWQEIMKYLGLGADLEFHMSLDEHNKVLSRMQYPHLKEAL